MRNVHTHRAAAQTGLHRPQPSDRPLLLSILYEGGLSETFSLERLLDRLDRQEVQP